MIQRITIKQFSGVKHIFNESILKLLDFEDDELKNNDIIGLNRKSSDMFVSLVVNDRRLSKYTISSNTIVTIGQLKDMIWPRRTTPGSYYYPYKDIKYTKQTQSTTSSEEEDDTIILEFKGTMHLVS